MVTTIISKAVQYKRVVYLLVLAGIVASFYSIKNSPLDAVPDISDPQIIIYSKWSRSPQLLESRVTYPIIRSLLGTKGLRSIRGTSFLGYSFVYAIMENDADKEKVRGEIKERLNSVRHKLPSDASIEIGPEASTMGWIYQYAIVDNDNAHDLRELRLLQEERLKTALESVQGVAEVATVGGLEKQYQLKIYPQLLAELNISLKELVNALKTAFSETGGRVLEVTNRDYQIRGIANAGNIDQVESLVIGYDRQKKAVQIRDIGYIQVGYDLRRGIADLNGKGEVVGGIVIMQQHMNVLEVMKRVHKKLEQLKETLPEGLDIVTTYDRSDLILTTLSTFFKTLGYEILVVILVTVIFLRSFRSVLAPVVVLLLGTLFTIIPLYVLGQPLNLFSLAGLFLALGEMADATIVIVENCALELSERDDDSWEHRRKIIMASVVNMARPLFFSLMIIIVSFLPVFFLGAREGKLFDPLAYSKTFAMFLSSSLTFFLLPGLILALFKGKPSAMRAELNEGMTKQYQKLLRFAIKYKYRFVAVNLLVLVLSLGVFGTFDRAFMPELEEGSILYMPTTLPGLPAKEAGWVLQEIDKKLKKFPEVKTVFGKLGRADTSTDPAPFTMVETTITLQKKQHWRPGMTMKKLIKEMNDEMKFTGFVNTWTQPIRGRVDMQTTGIQTPVGIKVKGKDISEIEKLSKKVEMLLKSFPGTGSVIAERISDGYFIDVQFDYEKLAAHGIPVDEAMLYVQFALGGDNVAWIKRENRLVPLSVQYAVDYISTVDKIKELMVITPDGGQLPISEIASVEVRKLPEMIRDEDGHLTGYIYIDIKGIGATSYVERAKSYISKKLPMPGGYWLEWAGQFQYEKAARKKLTVVIPITLAIIFLLLLFSLRSVSDSLLIMLSIPYALVGGIWLQWVVGYPMTIAVTIGYLGIYTVAVQTGIIMIIFIRQAANKRITKGGIGYQEMVEAVIEGSSLRLRPKLMTACTTMFSLVPVMLSSGQGIEIMKPIAAPTVAGMLTSSICVLFLIPCLYVIVQDIKGKRAKLH